MNARFKSARNPFLILSAAALCLLTALVPVQRAQEAAPAASPAPNTNYRLMTSYPPGAVAVFPDPVTLQPGEKSPVAFIKRAGAGQATQEWILSVELSEPETGGASVEGGVVAAADDNPAASPTPAVSVNSKMVAFTVPQLPRGAYIARYESPDRPGASSSIDLYIEPQLHTSDGVVKGKAGEAVEAQVGIDTTFLTPRGEGKPAPVQIEITLESSDASTADVAPDQPRTVKTGPDGYATWKIRLNKAGSAVLKASAVGFESAEIFAVATSDTPVLAGFAHAERAVEVAERRAEEEEEDLRFARSKLESTKAEMTIARQAEASTPKSAESGKETIPKTDASAKRKVSKAEAEVTRERNEWYQALDRLSEAEAKLATLGAAAVPEDLLLPGDILLVRGDSFVSKAIRVFEQSQLGRPVDYSHAALYVGEFNGQPMVVEMLNQGYTFQPLKASMQDDNVVDVYRWKDEAAMSPVRRQQIVAKALSFAGKKYAWSQIDLLRAAAGVLLPGESSIPLSLRAWAADQLSSGERKMICSEMVSWAYHYAGLDPEASGWWPVLSSILINDNRKHDYITPNTLAASDKFRFLIRLKPRA